MNWEDCGWSKSIILKVIYFIVTWRRVTYSRGKIISCEDPSCPPPGLFPHTPLSLCRLRVQLPALEEANCLPWTSCSKSHSAQFSKGCLASEIRSISLHFGETLFKPVTRQVLPFHTVLYLHTHLALVMWWYKKQACLKVCSIESLYFLTYLFIYF